MPFHSSFLVRTSLITILLLTAGVTMPAQAESLETAVEAALNQHPSVSAALANRDALKETEKEAKSDFYPQFNINATGGRVYGDNSTSRGLSVTRGAGYSWLWESGTSLSQPLFTGFETTHRLDAAEARRIGANFNILDIRETLGLQAVAAYIQVLQAQDALTRQQAYATKMNDYVGRIEAMLAQGGADQSMVVQARDIKAQLDSAVIGTQGQLRSAIAAYTQIVGHIPESTLARPVPPLDKIPASAEEAINYARTHHPTLRQLTMKEKAGSFDIQAENGAFFPDVNSELSYLKRDIDDVIGGEATDARAVVRANWNYEVGGAQEARVRAARHRKSEAIAQYQQAEREIAQQIQIAYSDRKAADEQMRIQRDRMNLNKDLLETQQVQFEASRVNILQLLQTENALFNASFALMSGEYKLLESQYTILASMGGLQQALNLAPATINGK